MNNLNDIWNAIKTLLKEELSQTALDTWFSSAELVDLDNNNAVICAANELAQQQIHSRFQVQLNNAFHQLFAQDFNLIIILNKDEYNKKKQGIIGNKSFSIPAYTFDNYVIDESNKFAYLAAKSVVDNPGSCLYNPLFIYGGSGLGKTHLLCATGAAIHEKFPGKKIDYIRADDFTNKLVNAIQTRTTDKFRDSFRNSDVLLLDDIQFIAGKQATQEEFYNTFNSIYESGHQIIITSDKPPKEMSLLEDRIRNRFEGGMLVDIRLPEKTLINNIIKQKTEDLNLKLREQDIKTIVNSNITNIRQVEGIIKTLYAVKDILKYNPTDAINRALYGVVKNDEATMDSFRVIKETSRFFEISESEIKSQSRSRLSSSARQIAMYIMRYELGMTLEEIGEFFMRNHSTVLASIKKVESLLVNDTYTIEAVKSIINRAKGKAA